MKQSEIQSLLNEQHTQIANMRNNLAETDYVVIRAKEQGLNLTTEFKAMRQGWRDAINECEAEIERLNSLEVEEEEL